MALRGDMVGDDCVWSWHTRISREDWVHARFEQSTFFGVPLSAGALRKQAASHRPALNEDGRITRVALDLMERSTPLGEIARQLSEQFPSRFSRRRDALSDVGDLSTWYGR